MTSPCLYELAQKTVCTSDTRRLGNCSVADKTLSTLHCTGAQRLQLLAIQAEAVTTVPMLKQKAVRASGSLWHSNALLLFAVQAQVMMTVHVSWLQQKLLLNEVAAAGAVALPVHHSSHPCHAGEVETVNATCSHSWRP